MLDIHSEGTCSFVIYCTFKVAKKIKGMSGTIIKKLYSTDKTIISFVRTHKLDVVCIINGN